MTVGFQIIAQITAGVPSYFANFSHYCQFLIWTEKANKYEKCNPDNFAFLTGNSDELDTLYEAINSFDKVFTFRTV